jgi:DNA-binding MarR family transcriptional regulator
MKENEELLQVSSMFRTFLNEVSKDWNKHGLHLTLTQSKILCFLKWKGPQKVSGLATLVGLTSSALTGLTDQLLKEKYIKKERAESDRRVVEISLTDKGNTVIEKIQQNKKQMMDKYFYELEPEDLQHLKRIFTTLLDNVRKRERNK